MKKRIIDNVRIITPAGVLDDEIDVIMTFVEEEKYE
jgi:hypothetical protein